MVLAQKQDMFVGQWNQIEDLDINLYTYGPLIHIYKCPKYTLRKKKTASSTDGAGQIIDVVM